MKHIYLLLLLFIIVGSNAQIRFAKPGAKWCIGSSSISGYHSNSPKVAVDSTINGIPCSYIPYFGCLYILNDTVYNIQYDNGNTEFLYDYGAQMGDTWIVRNDIPYPTQFVQFKVDSIRKFILGNDTLRRIYVRQDPNADSMYNCNYCFWGEILESVGSTRTSFLPGPWGFIDMNNPSFECYSDSIRGAIRNNSDLELIDSCSCKFTTGIEEADEDLVSISYSASQQAISIDLVKAEKVTVFLYNLSGQQVLEKEIGGTSYTVNTRALTSGIYFCTVAIEGYKPYTKKIVVL